MDSIIVTSIKVGKYDLVDSVPTSIARSQWSVDHQYAILLEWELPGPVSYVVLRPVGVPKVALCKTHGIQQSRMICLLPLAFFNQLLHLIGYYTEPPSSYYQPPPEV